MPHPLLGNEDNSFDLFLDSFIFFEISEAEIHSYLVIKFFVQMPTILSFITFSWSNDYFLFASLKYWAITSISTLDNILV